MFSKEVVLLVLTFIHTNEGFKNQNGPRVLGGIPAYLGEFKAIVSLQYDYIHKCCGSLIGL